MKCYKMAIKVTKNHEYYKAMKKSCENEKAMEIRNSKIKKP